MSINSWNIRETIKEKKKKKTSLKGKECYENKLWLFRTFCNFLRLFLELGNIKSSLCRIRGNSGCAQTLAQPMRGTARLVPSLGSKSLCKEQPGFWEGSGRQRLEMAAGKPRLDVVGAGSLQDWKGGFPQQGEKSHPGLWEFPNPLLSIWGLPVPWDPAHGRDGQGCWEPAASLAPLLATKQRFWPPSPHPFLAPAALGSAPCTPSCHTAFNPWLGWHGAVLPCPGKISHFCLLGLAVWIPGLYLSQQLRVSLD